MVGLKSVFSPRDHRARLLVRNARAALQGGQCEEAAQLFTRAIELCPEWAIAYAQRAEACLLLKRYEQAVDDCTAAISHDEYCHLAYNNRAVAYSRVRRNDDALADSIRAVELSPLNANYLANRGILCYETGNLAGAIDDLLTALRLENRHVPAQIHLAMAYSALGKDDLALQRLEQAIRLQPANAVSYKLCSEIHVRAGRPAAAVRALNAALKHGYPPSAGLVLRAQVLHHLGHDEAAIRDLSESIRQSPSFLALLLRSGIWTALGETAKAIDDAKEALQLLGDDSTNYGQRGLAYLRVRDFDRAFADFERMIEREPEAGLHYNNRGYVWHQRGDYERAIADYETAIRLSPDQPNAYKNLATLRANCPVQSHRDGAKAVELAQRALEIGGPKPRDWLCVLANSFVEAGDLASAELWLRKAEEPPPPVPAPPVVASVGSSPFVQSGPFQFSLGEALLVMTVLAVVFTISTMFWQFDDFMESFSVPGLMTLFCFCLIYFGARACWREIKRREPGHRAYYLGLACGAPVGMLHALSWYAHFFMQYDVSVSMGGLGWLLLLPVASSTVTLTCLYGFLGGLTASALGHAVKRFRGIQKLRRVTLD